mgnify:CR=1 FL=1
MISKAVFDEMLLCCYLKSAEDGGDRNFKVGGQWSRWAVNMVFKDMKQHNVMPDAITFHRLILTVAHSGNVQRVSELVATMTDDYGIRPRPEMLAQLIKFAVFRKDLDKAIELINHYFRASAATADGSEDESATDDDLTSQMGQFAARHKASIQPDMVALVLERAVESNDNVVAGQAFQRLCAAESEGGMGVQLDRGTHSAVLNLAALRGDVELAEVVHKSLVTLEFPDLPIYRDALFQAYINHGDVPLACGAFGDVYSTGELSPSSDTQRSFVDSLVASSRDALLHVREYIDESERASTSVHPALLSCALMAAARVGDFRLASHVLMRWDAFCRNDHPLYRRATITDWNALLQSCVIAFGDNGRALHYRLHGLVGGDIEEPSLHGEADTLAECASSAIDFLLAQRRNGGDDSRNGTSQMKWTTATHELVLLLQLSLHAPPPPTSAETLRMSRQAFLNEWEENDGDEELALSSYMQQRQRQLNAIGNTEDIDAQLASDNVQKLPKVRTHCAHRVLVAQQSFACVATVVNSTCVLFLFCACDLRRSKIRFTEWQAKGYQPHRQYIAWLSPEIMAQFDKYYFSSMIERNRRPRNPELS